MRLNTVSEDRRRRLSEFGEGKTWRIAKCLEIKENCIIGNHYHKLKDELFLVISGEVTYTLNGEEGSAGPGDLIDVPAGVHHAFICPPGAVLVCLATQLHDPKDDHN